MNKKLDDLVEYYNNHDCIESGEYLLNKKYWYIWFDHIQYGYLDPNAHGANLDGNCKNRVSFYNEATFLSFGHQRTVRTGLVSDTKIGIIKIYVKELLKSKMGQNKLKRIEKIFPELLI